MSINYIDWSCKHDIMIENPDGSLSPMDEPFYENEKVAPGTWKILSSGDYSYLLEGEEKAVAIDTGYGAGNIREYLQGLTDRPLWEVINTHDHFDHTANNAYFEKAYMAEATIPLATCPFQSFQGIDFHDKEYERVAIHEGELFDLGGRSLRVFEFADHAVGSVLLLDEKERLLFSGDEFMPMGKILNVSIEDWHGYMQKLVPYRSKFDRICGGFGIADAALFDQLLSCTEYILDGHPGEEVDAPPHPVFPLRYDPAGRLVYDRIRPHPGDGGAGKMGEAMKRVRHMEHGGIPITYDPSLSE